MFYPVLVQINLLNKSNEINPLNLGSCTNESFWMGWFRIVGTRSPETPESSSSWHFPMEIQIYFHETTNKIPTFPTNLTINIPSNWRKESQWLQGIHVNVFTITREKCIFQIKIQIFSSYSSVFRYISEHWKLLFGKLWIFHNIEWK